MTHESPADRRFVLFVYGTLLAGESGHALLDGATPLGPVITPPAYDLYELGPYPAMVAGGATSVVGELYELGARALAAIDVHEQVPILFKRRRIALTDGREVETYLLEPEQVRGRRKIRGGDWRTRFAPMPAPGARDSAMVRWARSRTRG